MEQRNFKNIRMVLGEPSEDVRFGLRSALTGAGFDKIEDTSRFDAVRHSVANGRADLVVCAMNMGDGNFGDLIRQIRHQEIGDNPFVAIITLIPMADEPMIRKAIGSGTDDILVMPVSPENLMKRVHHLCHERKPFVVTTDYIGPDRRTKHRPGTMKIPQIQVPNPLNVMTQPDPDRDGLLEEIKLTSRRLNDQKVERHAFQIVYLVDRIVEAMADKLADGDVAGHLGRLSWVAGDINHRVGGSQFVEWAGNCRSLVQVVDHIQNNGAAPSETDLFALGKLAQAFRHAIQNPGPTAQAG